MSTKDNLMDAIAKARYYTIKCSPYPSYSMQYEVFETTIHQLHAYLMVRASMESAEVRVTWVINVASILGKEIERVYDAIPDELTGDYGPYSSAVRFATISYSMNIIRFFLKEEKED